MMYHEALIAMRTRTIALVNCSLLSLLFCLLFASCKSKEKKNVLKKFSYEAFKDSVSRTGKEKLYDSSNIFDSRSFTPGVDSLDTLLTRFDTLLHRQAKLLDQLDTFITHIKKQELYTPEEKTEIKTNLRMLDSFLLHRNQPVAGACSGKDCIIYAEIIKSTQTLYLYVEGELKDSFLVSTGKGKKYETPEMSGKPRGPLFMKYTSRKFPGGDYKGLGNMPYAVFVRGGYAIHGTTPGNFSKLGNKASHGCIRLHPDNARIFYELVKLMGLEHTWVTIREHAPEPEK